VIWGRSTAVVLIVAAAALLAPVLEPWPIEVRRIEPDGREYLCAPGFARLELPDRATLRVGAFLEDLAYAAAAAEERGAPVLVAAIALLSILPGLWGRGLRCGMRRLLLVFALGAPITVGLLYASCFLEGRRLVLGPEASGYVLANLHAHSDRSTGLLPPADLVRWHWSRGFRAMSVTDKNLAEPGMEAAAAARVLDGGRPPEPPILVLPGEEYQGDAHVVLLGARETYAPDRYSLAQALDEVRRGGGAAILAHPWYGIRMPHPLERMLETNVDAVEVVNRAVQGGMQTLNAVERAKKALVGALDYKHGPHVTAATLFPERAATSLAGVVEALRERRTRVLFAVPGGAMASTSYDTQPLWLNGARAGLRSLLETPRSRRVVWIGWIAVIAALWTVGTRQRANPGRRGLWRTIFFACALLELLLLAPLSWQVRGVMGTIPVRALLAAGALVAVPLLASAHNLACAEE